MNKRGLLTAVCASLLAAGLCACGTTPDVPGDAKLMYYGPVSHPETLESMMPVTEEGGPLEVYIYDDTDQKVVAVRTIDSHHRDLDFVWRSDHQYRIYVGS